jgi:hypothetical protein
MRKVHETQVGLIFNGAYQLLVIAHDVSLPGDNIATIKKKTEISIDASKEVGIKIDVEKTKCLLLSCNIERQNHDMKRADRALENGTQFKYLRTTEID